MWKANIYCTLESHVNPHKLVHKLSALRNTGRVTLLRFVTTANKTFGFVRFSHPMSIKQALQTLNLGCDFDLKLNMDQQYAERVLSEANPMGFGSIHNTNLSNSKLNPLDPYALIKDKLAHTWTVFQTTRWDVLTVRGCYDLTPEQLKCFFTRKLAFQEQQGRFGIVSCHNKFDKIGYRKKQQTPNKPEDEQQPEVVIALAPTDEMIAPITMETIITGKRFVHGGAETPSKRQRVILFDNENKLPDYIKAQYQCQTMDMRK